jgi:hypothetical protein
MAFALRITGGEDPIMLQHHCHGVEIKIKKIRVWG